MSAVVGVASHRIHTIHGSFGGPSFTSLVPAAASSAEQASRSSFNSLPNVSYSRAAGLSILGSRTSQAQALSFTTSSKSNAHSLATNQHGSLFTPRTKPRRDSFVAPVSTRRAPPPPPVKVQTVPVSVSPVEDPFADMYSATDCFVVSLPPPRRPARSAPPQQTQPSVSVPPPSVTSMLAADPVPPVVHYDNQRAAKLVASVLLNRACGRPMRRRSLGAEKTYVKSCLSNMITVEA